MSLTSSMLSPGTAVELRERLALALSASHTGVWEWDLAAKKMFWSTECFTIMGVQEFDGSLNSFIRHVFPDDQAQIVERAKSAIACRGEYQCEFRILRSSGKLAWIANLGRARFDETGRAQSCSARRLSTSGDSGGSHEAQQILKLGCSG